jgi:large repetitive protein
MEIKEMRVLCNTRCGGQSSRQTRHAVAVFWALALWILVATPLWAQAPGTWEPTNDLHQPRAGQTATLLTNGKVLIAGGKAASGQALASAEIYDPASGQYTQITAQLPTPVWGHTATGLQDGKVLLTGGYDSSGQPLAQAQLFDPSTSRFTTLTPLGTPRTRHTATLLSDGRVLIAGGTDGTKAVGDLEIYDSATRTFSAAPNALLEPRQNHTTTVLPDGWVLIAGGSGASGVLHSAELYEPQDGYIIPVGSLTAARTLASAALLLDGTILVAGGQGADQQDLDSAELYDPNTDTFTPLSARMTSVRSGQVGLILPHNGKVLLVGGTSGSQLLSTAEVYDPILQTFWEVGSLEAARELFGTNVFALTYPGVLLVSGGLDSTHHSLASSELFFYPTLRSDKPDYQPGALVTLWGEGWVPHEAVTLTVQESSGDPDTLLTATADASGAFTNSAFQIATDRSDVGIRFVVTASGQQSQWTAQTTFTDATYHSDITLAGPTPTPVNAGGTLSWSATAVCTSAPGSTPCIPVPTSYTINLEQFSGTKCSGASTVVSTRTQGALGSTTFTAPLTGGSYSYRAQHPNENPGGNNWPPTDSNCNTITINQDTTPPTLSLPGNLTQEATGPSGALVTFTATATDQNPLTPQVTCNPVSGSMFPLGVTTINCSASDAAGNLATGNFRVTVRDTTPPLLQNVPASLTAEATGPTGAPVSYQTPTAMDVVDGLAAVTCTPTSGSTIALGAATVTCSATDKAGNTANRTFVVTVVDTTPPALSLPATITAEASGSAGAGVTYTATAADAVDGSRPVTCSPASGSNFAIGTTTVTCAASDTRGNTATSSFTVTVQDTTKPSLTLPAAITVEATGLFGAAVPYVVGATDVVDGAVAVTCSSASSAPFALGTTVVTCTATDTHGNTASGSFAVTVVDTTPPSLTVPADMTVEATGPSGATVSYSTSAMDLVNGTITPSCAPASGSTFPLAATMVTCAATDAAGNTASKSFHVTVHDTTPPVVTVPADITAEATGASGAAVSFSTSAADIVDGPTAVICTPASGSTFALGNATVTCSATDAHGNTGSAGFTVMVVDTTPPSLSLPADITAEATGPSGAAVSYTASASDLVDGVVVITCEPGSGTTVALGTTTVTCTATDTHGNTATGSFTVLVRDTTPPSLTVPTDRMVEATGPSGAAVTYTATATDLVDGSVAVTCAPASGATFALGATEVSCTSTDAHHNTGSASFTVTVRDTTPPNITVPADITAEASGPAGAVVTYTASATDLVDGNVAVICSSASGATFALGLTPVTCAASDAHGNTARANFRVTVRDTTPPALTLPGHLIAEATGPSGVAVTYTASAIDVVDGSVAPSCSPASGTIVALGITTVTCSATDTAGNRASGSFTVTVVDTTPPLLTLPAPITAEATGPGGALVSYAASATDLVDGSVAVPCSPASGLPFALGSTTVTCSAIDAHGNTASASFTVTVQDTTPPSFNLPADMTTHPTGLLNGVSVATVTYEASATDLVDGAVAVSCSPASGAIFAMGTTTVTCSASDMHANKTSRSFTVTVVYNWDGFFRPVENDGVVNQVKAGSAIPVKFSLHGYWGLTIFANGSPKWVVTTCTTWDMTNAVDETVTAGSSSLSYDATADQYVYVWKTDKAWAVSCRQLNVLFRDGTTYSAKFRFTK